jgi:hypothetical protein
MAAKRKSTLPTEAGAVIAALYVQRGGCYWDLPDVDPWDEARDARKYAGPWPVVAHPPCQRWGRYWHGSTRKPHQYELGADDGCFDAAISAVRQYGGVIEHPAHSHAWKRFGLPKPSKDGGWWEGCEGFSCHVEQGHYGHLSRKVTWLYYVGGSRPPQLSIIWGPSPQRLPAYAVERYGYEKARRIGVMAAIGGKNKTEIRNATPLSFRDLLISIAQTALLSRNTVPEREIISDQVLTLS